MMEHKGFTLWFTGLPCSGKTTIADEVANKLRTLGMKVERLDGDTVRQGLTRDLGFSKEDRAKNIERVTFVAKLLTRNEVAVLATFVSPYNEIRHNSRKEIGEFILVYVKCQVCVCEERDVKGMYAKARKGLIKDFTGVDDPFEEPDDADIIVNSDKQTIEECKNTILKVLDKKGYLLK